MTNRLKIEQEIQAWAANNPGLNVFDAIRRQKLQSVKQITGRPILVYATDFLNPKLPPNLQQEVSIGWKDKDYFAEIVESISVEEIDILIHSPGGSAEATESIVDYLRSKFKHIRIFVPGIAKSAATMLAMSANVIMMDDLSELGPTDPQMLVNGRFSPAGAIIKQFEFAESELKADPAKITAWLPFLQHYGPALLVECENHLNLSKQLISKWLSCYMFGDSPTAKDTAFSIAEWLANDENFLSHGRRIGVELLQEKGLNVYDLRKDPTLKDAVRELYLSITYTFDNTGAFKLFENSENNTLAMSIALQQFQVNPPFL